MTQQKYREMATRALEAGWSPTQAFDEYGRPLWVVPRRDGLVPLEDFARTELAPIREAA